MPRRQPRDRLRHRGDMRRGRTAAAAEDVDLAMLGPFAHEPSRRLRLLVIFAEFVGQAGVGVDHHRSEEHTSELQSLMRISYAVFCLKKKTHTCQNHLLTTKAHITT